MGADGGREEVWLNVNDGPPGIGDGAGLAGLLFKLCGGGAGWVRTCDKSIKRLRPAVERGVVGSDLELELLVRRLSLQLGLIYLSFLM